MARVLLILPTGTYRADAFLLAAERLGVEAVVASEQAQALAEMMGDRFLEVPLDDPGEASARIVELALRPGTGGLDAVIGVDDQGLVAAALAARELGLRGSPPEAVALTRDKAAMRSAFASTGVPQPDFAPAHSLGEVTGAAEHLGFPVVVKPTSLSASRGVIRADSITEAEEAALRIRRILEAEGEPADAPLLVERFVPGPEVAVEGLLRDGELAVVTIFDKPDPLDGPYFEETLYLSPTSLSASLVAEVTEAVEAAAGALGLTEGPVHAELRIPALAGGDEASTEASVSVIEIAARTIGGRCSKAMVLSGGGSLEELVIQNALGAHYPPPSLAGPCGVLMIPIPLSGVLRSVGGLDDVGAIEGVTGVEITIPKGRPVRRLPEGDRYLGFVFAAAPTRDGAEAALRQAAATLVVEIEPFAPGTVT